MNTTVPDCFEASLAERISRTECVSCGKATMQTIHAKLQVNYGYAVHFTTNLFAPENPLLRTTCAGEHASQNTITVHSKRPARILFVIEQEVERHHGVVAQIEAYCRANADALTLVCTPLILPGGEKVKNDPAHITRIHAAVNDTGLDRHSYLAAVGGGALLDAVGYAAATAHRGVRHIRIPTTTLAQNDSGVGVKNAINYFGKKNWVGTFAPAWAVLNDFHFLTTQPDRVWREGIAEAVKVALIKDADFFEFLEGAACALRSRDMDAMKQLVHRCAELHMVHICTGGDPFEMGSSRPLDFGHWAAHKLEQLTQHRLHHGEAVAIGLALDVTYSHLQGWITAEERARILKTLADVGFALYDPLLTAGLDDPDAPDSLFRGLREFREHLGGELTIQMLRRIGEGFNVHEIDETLMAQSIRLLEHEAIGKTPQTGSIDAHDGRPHRGLPEHQETAQRAGTAR